MNDLVFYSEQISSSFVWGGNTTLNKSWKDRNVIIPHNKLFYITDGEICLEIEGQKLNAKSGDMVLVPSGKKHSYSLKNTAHAKKFWLHFDVTVSGKNLFDIYRPPFKISIGKNGVVEKLFRSVLLNAKSDKPEKKLCTSSAILSLVSYYLEHSYYTQNVDCQNEIDTVMEYVKNNFSEVFTLDQLARIVNFSPTYFAKKFKERTGYSPIQYSMIIKMERAKFLIEQSSEPIAKIMTELGFLDASHFSKLFKKYCGYSPKNFRKISKQRFALTTKNTV